MCGRQQTNTHNIYLFWNFITFHSFHQTVLPSDNSKSSSANFSLISAGRDISAPPKQFADIFTDEPLLVKIIFCIFCFLLFGYINNNHKYNNSFAIWYFYFTFNIHKYALFSTQYVCICILYIYERFCIYLSLKQKFSWAH